MALKLLRLYHFTDVTAALRRLMEKLSDIFYLHRYLFVNLLSWFKAGLLFLLFVHYFACGWIMIYYYKQRNGLPSIDFSGEDLGS